MTQTPPSGRPPRAYADFETRSAVDLFKCGSGRYFRDPSARVLCLGFALPAQGTPEEREVHVWYPDWLAHQFGLPLADRGPLEELLAHVGRGGEVEAHNAGFDAGAWNLLQCEAEGWPEVPPEQWRCTSSAAAAWGLPLSLDAAAGALRVPLKSPDGKKLVDSLCRPRKGGEFGGTAEEFERLFAYCAQDVRVGLYLSWLVPDLSDDERAVWEADYRANEAGLPVDEELCRAALAKFGAWRDGLNAELLDLTGVERGSQREQVRAWLASREVHLPDTAGDTVDHFLSGELPLDVRRVLRVLRGVNRTSTAKYRAMLAYSGGSGRARRGLVYHGAKTGRWVGRGFQPHNLPRGAVKDMDAACADVLSLPVAALEEKYGDVGALLSGTVRGAVAAPPGRRLLVADYAAIEARVLLWLAGDEGGLDVFRRGECIYCAMASDVYRRPVTKAQPEERQLGKQAVLGLGYGMGDATFLVTLARYGVSLTVPQALAIMGRERLREAAARQRARLAPGPGAEPSAARQAEALRARLASERVDLGYAVWALALCRFIVAVYRDRRSAVVRLWGDAETAALGAVADGPGATPREAGRCLWSASALDGALECRLPSGRLMRYPSPAVRRSRTPWGDTRAQLTHLVARGRGMTRVGTYGGQLVENVTQAAARDLLAAAMVRADRDPRLAPLMTVHDELVCEADAAAVSPEEYAALVSEVPPWADGCPVSAEAHELVRYRK
jgi:DNA polymerase